MALYKISSSRVNNIEADQYTGSVVEEGLIWYDPNNGILRLYNGEQGGYIISGGNATPIAVEYNGNLITSSVTSFDFTGNGVSVSNNGSAVTVDIASSGVTDTISNGTSNVKVYENGNVAISVHGTSNVAVFSNPVTTLDNVIASCLTTSTLTATGNISGSNISVNGNITAGYFLGNGALLTGLPATYSNANVAAYLPTYSGNISANNITATGRISTTGNVSGQYIFGDGGFLSNITVSSNVAVSQISNGSTVISVAGANGNTITTVNGIANILVSTPEGISVTGNVLATGNVSGTYFLGNGALLTGISPGLPDQANSAGFVLTTDGDNISWNSGIAGSLTFYGGKANTIPAAATLDGGASGAAATYDGEATIYGGAANSNFELTLPSVAFTGQYEDLVDVPGSTNVPATTTSAGYKGQITFDTQYLYVCVNVKINSISVMR